MAHALTERKDGFVEFASAKLPAWHGLGQVVGDVMTTEEAVKESGLDWEVNQSPLSFRYVDQYDGKRKMSTIDKEVVNWRYLNGEPYKLGIVNKTYQVVQNSEGFDFFDGIVGSGEAIIETAGSIHGGKRVFITAKFPDYIQVDNDPSMTELYCVLSMGHDGRVGSGIQVIFTPVRVVCNNTLHAAFRSTRGNRLSIKHTKSAQVRMAEAAKILKIKNLFTSEMQNFAQKSSGVKITDQKFEEMTYKLLKGHTLKVGEEVGTRLGNTISEVVEYYNEDPTQVDIRGNVWGAYNAWSSFIQRKQSRIEGKAFDDFIKGSNSWERTFQIAAELIK